MAIFALVATVLFVLVGLSIDAGTAYLGSDAAERAAAGGALTGVTYLPGDPTMAATTALQEAARNGFANGDITGGRNVSVTTVATGPHRLKVTVSQTVYTSFMHIIGFGSVRVSRSAEAEYLPPIRLGQPGYGIGTMLCVNGKDDQGGNNCLGAGGNNSYYFMREEGWANHRSEGDAFTPNPDSAVQNNSACGSGGSQPCAPNPADTHILSAANGTETSNSSLPDRGGYNYLVYVPPGRKLNVQVYNPLFAPDYDGCQGASGGCSIPSYHEYDSSFSLGSSNAADYSSIAYTVYSVPNLFQHTGESVLSQTVFSPIDASPIGHGNNYYYRFDTSQPASSAQTKVTSTLPATYHKWIDVGNYSPSGLDANLVALTKLLPTNAKYLDGGASTGSGAYYRLKVSTLDWKGNPPSGTSGSYAHKGYAVRLVDTTASVAPCTSANPNCGSTGQGAACAPQTQGCVSPATLSSLDDMAFYTPVVDSSNNAETFDIPAFQLDSSYAGKNIAINVFDPGDVSGTATMSVTLPAYTGTGGTTYTKQIATIASGVSDLGNQLNTLGGGTAITPLQPNKATIQTSSGSSSLYNGNWIHFVVKVPNDWQPPNTGNPTASDYWSLEYGVGSNSIADDTVTLQVGYDGTPVHLLP